MKKNILFILMAGMAVASQAQTEVAAESKAWLLNEGRRLYSEKEYSTALVVLDKLQDCDLNDLQRQEADYLFATATFEIDPLKGRALVLQYLDDYPESGKNDILASYIAESYYYNHNFVQANNWFKKADFERLAPDDAERARLHYALTLQECGEEAAAQNLLNSLRLTGKRHSNDAVFHLAVIDYDKGNLQQAYEGFKSIEMDDEYYLEVPYYLAAIYLKNRENVRAEKVATLFLQDNADKKQGIPMRQILGAAYFGQKRYSEAIPQLEQYIGECREPQRIAYYQLALSCFETGRYQDAIPMFDKCTNVGDVMAQNAYLHIGIIQLKFNDITKARLAFEMAASMNYDSRIREEALYNYALCIHQTRYSPFAESVKVFEQFLNDYPDSPHAPQVSKYLVEVYMNTRNYDVALQSINKINRPSVAILEAKQKVLYRLGVQSYIDNNMPQAIDYMNRSIELSRYNRQTHSNALYWRGEAQYNQGNYQAAINSYRAAVALGEENVGNALYGLGYTCFQTERFQDALSHFNRSLQHIPASQTALRADVYNRMGDCYFYNRNYSSADQYYKRAVETDKSQGDYSLYRAAVAQGLVKDYNGKVASLQRLVQNHPNSSYAQQALFEMGRTYVSQEKFGDAITAFNTLKQNYPGSALARRAAVEVAMIHNQNGNNERAAEAYKQVIKNYPYSEEAQIAAQDLKNIYVEMGRVDDFAKYASTTPGMKAMKSSELDTLTYIAAERIYSRGNIPEAKREFERYIKAFPEGSFLLNSHYYLGLIFYNQQAPADALLHLGKVIAYSDNKYSEEAMVLAAELYYNGEKYAEAMNLYEQIIAKSGNEERRLSCRMNLMRCAYILNNDAVAADAATQLLSVGNISPEWEREIRYTRAKSYLRSGKAETSITDLKTLSRDTRSRQGAEAKYLLARHYFDTKRYDDCEKEILNYIEESTPHAYWLARSFVLLADLYTLQGRAMEAKQYLLSLQNNYSGNDDIASMISERLEKLSDETAVSKQ